VLDIQSEDSLPGLSVVGAELVAEGKAIAKIAGTPSLRVQQGAPTDSLGALDTVELSGGALPSGNHRLRIGTRLDGTLVELQGRYPDQCHVVLGDETGRTLSAEGKLEPPWEPPAHPGGTAPAPSAPPTSATSK
jgi:hypothetical protein